MAKKNFLLISLDDEKAKTVANVVQNSSCKKILDYLSTKDATETEIAENLNLPISTVHYNLGQLMGAKLVEWNKFHYSEKGREVKHYSLANKYIIIAPKGESKESFLEKIKTILPSLGFGFLGAFGIFLLNKFNLDSSSEMTKSVVISESSRAAAYNTVMIKETNLGVSPQIVSEGIRLFHVSFDSWIWFLLGFILGVFVYVVIEVVRKKFFKGKK